MLSSLSASLRRHLRASSPLWFVCFPVSHRLPLPACATSDITPPLPCPPSLHFLPYPCSLFAPYSHFRCTSYLLLLTLLAISSSKPLLICAAPQRSILPFLKRPRASSASDLLQFPANFIQPQPLYRSGLEAHQRGEEKIKATFQAFEEKLELWYLTFLRLTTRSDRNRGYAVTGSLSSPSFLPFFSLPFSLLLLYTIYHHHSPFFFGRVHPFGSS